MPISLGNLRDELMPGLWEIARKIGQEIVAYQEFERDVLVLKAGDRKIEITCSEIEDGRHLPRLRTFLEQLLEARMCAKVAGSIGPPPPPDEFYNALMTTKAAVADSLFLQELSAPAPKPAKPSWPPAPELILNDD